MHYQRRGDLPRRRHVVHHHDGQRLHEELIGQQGFASSSSLLYHRHSPSALTAIEAIEAIEACVTPDRPLTPRHIRTSSIDTGDDMVFGRRVLLANDDVRISWVAASRTAPLHRDATGDELVYVQAGQATVRSAFGDLVVRDGDYVVIPASVTHEWLIESGPVEALVVEARGHIAPPARYCSDTGQFLEHAPYCERDIRTPSTLVARDDRDVEVVVRTRAGLSRHIHAHHPFDVVGWDGCVYPWAFSIHDFAPIVGAVHQPPPVHQTFAGPGFVVCSFVPRPYDFGPGAVKVPYHHANTDSDEVLFYSAGNFMSRAGSGIGPGSISFHPAGFVHGPQPGSFEASIGAARTEEVAVMIDTFSPLAVSDLARAASDPDYPFSWAR